MIALRSSVSLELRHPDIARLQTTTDYSHILYNDHKAFPPSKITRNSCWFNARKMSVLVEWSAEFRLRGRTATKLPYWCFAKGRSLHMVNPYLQLPSAKPALKWFIQLENLWKLKLKIDVIWLRSVTLWAFAQKLLLLPVRRLFLLTGRYEIIDIIIDN